MTLEQIINQYIEGLGESARESNTHESNLKKSFQDFLKQNISSFSNDGNELVICASDYLGSYTSDKERLNNKIMAFFSYLNSEYGLSIDVETEFSQMLLLPKDYRQLEIMKYLHIGPKTREQIASHFNITTKTLSEDLKELQQGISFLGYEMKIDLKHGNNTYESTIHPVFLPLNLSEVYALTVGLKKVGWESPFHDIFDYIADAIYAQLSGYGQDRISHKAKELGIEFQPPIDKKYRYEKELLTNSLPGDRVRMLAYYLKSGAECRVDYDTAEGIISAVGRIDYANKKDGPDCDEKIKLIGKNQEKLIIEIAKIASIDLI